MTSSPPTHPHLASNVEQAPNQRQAEAFLCDRCTWPLAAGCTCTPKPGAHRDVERRHREAVKRAEASGWAEQTRLTRYLPSKHRFPVDPTGRRWVA